MPVPGMDPKTVAVLTEQLTAMFKKHGGPRQYVRNVLPTVAQRNAFVQWMWEKLPERDDLFYQHDAALLPMLSDEQEIAQTLPSVLHPCHLGVDPPCSLKPPCGGKVGFALTCQVLLDGLVTAPEPLVLKRSPALEKLKLPTGVKDADGNPVLAALDLVGTGVSLAPQSVAYIKGQNRNHSPLIMGHQIISCNMIASKLAVILQGCSHHLILRACVGCVHK